MRWRTDIILARDYDFGERGDVDMFPEHFLRAERFPQINAKVRLMKREKESPYKMYFRKG